MTPSPAHYLIKGDSLNAGLIDDRAARTMSVLVVNGRAYVQDGPDTLPLRVNVSGEIGVADCWAGYGFLPDEGEIDRVERSAGHQVFARV